MAENIFSPDDDPKATKSKATLGKSRSKKLWRFIGKLIHQGSIGLAWMTIGFVLLLSLQNELGTRKIELSRVTSLIIRNLLVVTAILFAIQLLWRVSSNGFLNLCKHYFKFGWDKEPDESWKEYSKRFLKTENPDLFEMFKMLVILWVSIGFLTPLVGTIFAFSSYITAEAQNQITLEQNALTANQAVIDMQWRNADRKATLIEQVLLDPQSSLSMQSHALSVLPETMVMPVTVNSFDDSGLSHKITHYPNLGRLKEVLNQFIKRPRVSEHLGKNGYADHLIHWMPPAQVESLRSMSDISCELITCLYKLGTQVPLQNERPKSLWLIEEIIHRHEQKEKVTLKRMPSRTELADINLTFLNPGTFAGLSLPYFRANENWKLIFPVGANLHSCQFQGSNLSRSILIGGGIRSSNLQKVLFVEADLFAAIFHETDLSNANFTKAKLQGTSFTASKLDDADFTGADFGGLSWRDGCLKANKETSKAESPFEGTLFRNIKSAERIRLIGKDKDGKFIRCTFISGGAKAWMDDVSHKTFVSAIDNEYHQDLGLKEEARKLLDELRKELQEIHHSKLYSSELWSQLLSERGQNEGLNRLK